jgi:hypothetical protein
MQFSGWALEIVQMIRSEKNKACLYRNSVPLVINTASSRYRDDRQRCPFTSYPGTKTRDPVEGRAIYPAQPVSVDEKAAQL